MSLSVIHPLVQGHQAVVAEEEVQVLQAKIEEDMKLCSLTARWQLKA